MAITTNILFVKGHIRSYLVAKVATLSWLFFSVKILMNVVLKKTHVIVGRRNVSTQWEVTNAAADLDSPAPRMETVQVSQFKA